MQVVIRGSKRVEEGTPENFHWRFIVSLNGEGVHYPNLLVMSFNNRKFQVVNLNAPLRPIPPGIALLLSKEAANYEEQTQ